MADRDKGRMYPLTKSGSEALAGKDIHDHEGWAHGLDDA